MTGISLSLNILFSKDQQDLKVVLIEELLIEFFADSIKFSNFLCCACYL